MSNLFAASLARALNTTTSMEDVDVDINIGEDVMEDEILDVDGAAVSPVAPATDEPIIEAQETELQSDNVEIVAADDEIEEADGDVETLESIQLVLQNSLANEGVGLSIVSYEMLNINMDHIYRKYGISSALVMPSMEAFGGDQKAQTVVSLEKVSDTLKTIGESAKEMLKKLWFKVKQFIVNLLTLNLSIQKRVNAVEAKAKEVGDDSKRGEIKLYSGNRLHIGGKVPPKRDILSNYAKVVEGNVKLVSVASSYLDTFVKTVANVINNQTVTVSQDQGKIYDAVRAPLGYYNLNGNFAFQDAKFVKGILDGRGGNEGDPGLKFQTTKAPDRGQDSEGYKVEPLTCSEIQDVCSKLTISIKGLADMGKLHTHGEIEKLIVELVDYTQTKGIKGGSTVEAINNIPLANSVQKAIRHALNAHTKVINYVNSINKAMLDYCVQSLGAYSKPAEDVKPTEPTDNSKAVATTN